MNWVNGTAAHALTAIMASASTALVTGYFEKETQQVAKEPAYVEQLQQRIGSLEQMVNQQNAQILTLTLKNADLTRLLGGSVEEVQLDGVFTYIDALERPAWCKQIEYSPGNTPIFRMRYLNYAYELAYGVSVQKYIGGTDFDNHPKEIAEAYYENDLLTYRSKDYEEFIEPFSSEEDPQVYRRQFAKFYVAMPTGPELICGLQINGLPQQTLETLLSSGN